MNELIETQKGIIGSVLIDPSCISKLYGYLDPECFTYLRLRKCYKAMLELYGNGEPITALSVTAMATDDTTTEDNIFSLLKTCAECVVTSAEIEYHAGLLVENWKMKKVKDILKNPVGEDSGDIISNTINSLNDLQKNKKTNIKTLPEILEENIDSFFRPKKKGLQTGINLVDDLIGWIEDTDLVCIAARPAVGKSAFVAQLALNIAKSGKKIQYYSMDMSSVQVLQRLISNIGKMDFKRVRTAERFVDDEILKFQEATGIISEMKNIRISEDSGKSVGDIRNECKFLNNLGCIIIDYLQLMRPEKNYPNRATEVGTISRGLKQLSAELHVPIIILSQLNRASESRQGKEPSMADLRESGDIEQDCNTIIMLWNKNENDLSIKGIKVEKARQGRTGKGTLKFDGQHMRFYQTEYYNPMKKNDSFMNYGEETPFDN